MIITPNRIRYGVEIKSASDIAREDLGGDFESLNRHGAIAKKICVTTGVRPYTADGVTFMLWQDFF